MLLKFMIERLYMDVTKVYIERLYMDVTKVYD